VRVLLDEQLPRLVPYLVGHEVRTVKQERWTGLKNGELIRKAETAGFDVFLTGVRLRSIVGHYLVSKRSTNRVLNLTR
jgi:hypothetical protein